jgi:chromosomal replication initiation ATPase DnaA
VNTPAEIRYRLAAHGLLETAQALAKEYRVALDDLLGRNRTPTVVRARHHFWMLVRHTLDWSYPEIAKLFGADHSTVLCGVRKCEARVLGAKERAA